jgi:cystathionine beta-lyase
LDFRGLGLSLKDLDDFIIQKANLGLDDGPMFGVGGEGFQRVNIACPRTVLREALERVERAVAQI